MINKIWSALSIVRHAVAITIVMSAAGATVAGSVHGPSADRGAQAASNSTSVNAAPVTTAMTTDLERQATMSVNAQTEQTGTRRTATNEPKPPVETAKHEETKLAETPKPATTAEPKHETTTTEPRHETTTTTTSTTADESLSLLVKDCVAKYTALKTNTDGATQASEACRKAIAATGLSSSDFWARFGPKTAPTAKPETTKKPEATKKPETSTRPDPATPTTTVTTAQIEILVKDCFARYLIAKNTKEGGDAAVEACHKAMSASGLTGDAFWAKFGRPGTN